MGSSIQGFDIASSDTDYIWLYIPNLSELLDTNPKLSYETEVDGNKVTVMDLSGLVNNLNKLDINNLQLLYQLGNHEELSWYYDNRVSKNVIMD